MLTFATGYLHEPLQPSDRTFGADVASELLRIGTVFGDGKPDMRPLVRARLLQGSGESCVAFAMAGAIQCGILARLPIEQWPLVPTPSPAWIWAIGRRQEQAGSTDRPALTNRGLYPRKAVAAIQRLGWVPWKAWPYVDHEAAANDAPAVCYHLGFEARDAWAGWLTPGPGLVDQIARCLIGLVPVVLCMNIDQAFMRYTGGTILWVDPNATAGHAMQVLAVLDGGDLVLRNWWTNGDENGFFTIARSVAEGPNVQACFALIPPLWPPA